MKHAINICRLGEDNKAFKSTIILSLKNVKPNKWTRFPKKCSTINTKIIYISLRCKVKCREYNQYNVVTMYNAR